MKRFAWAAPLLITVLLLLLGVNMPRLVSLVLDHRLEAELVRREDTRFSLALTGETDFLETLELFHSKNTQISLSDGCRMTAEEVETAAVDVLAQLAISDTTVYEAPEVTPMLVTGQEKASLSGVFWRCVWKRPDGSREILWMDDQNGLMAALQVKITGPVDDTIRAFREPIMRVAELCRKQYPVKNVILGSIAQGENNSDYSIILSDEKDGSDYSIILTDEKDGAEETYTVPIRLRDEWLYFNI